MNTRPPEFANPTRSTSFLTSQDGQQPLERCLRDEPEWRGQLWVEEIELDDGVIAELELDVKLRRSP